MTVIVVVNVLGGGMRAITLVQAFQYWGKLFAIAAPTFVLFVVFLGEPEPAARSRSTTTACCGSPSREVVDGRGAGAAAGQRADERCAREGTVDGAPATAPCSGARGRLRDRRRHELSFAAGSPVPVVDGAPTTNDELAAAADRRHLPTCSRRTR